MTAKESLAFVGLLSDVGLYVLANATYNRDDLSGKLHRKVLETRIELLGHMHPDTLTSMASHALGFTSKQWCSRITHCGRRQRSWRCKL